ncbi:uncharacterized protein PHA67_019283 [Liasis olivaceus]
MELNDEDQNESASSFSFQSSNSRNAISAASGSLRSVSSPAASSSKEVLQTTASQKCTIPSFIDKMRPENQEKIDHALARAIYASGSALSITENAYWQEAFKLLRPSYHLPSRHSLSKPLLESEYEHVMESVQGKISEALCLAVLTDGWTNVWGEGIINFVITTPQPVFYRSIETGENRHTAEYITSEICAVLEKIESGKVFALLTDNASNMKAAWEIIMDKYPHITAIGCASHGLNLLLSDFMKLDTFQRIYRNAKEVIKYVKATHVVTAVFKKKQEEENPQNKIVTLNLCSKTRWGGVVISFESLLKNKEALQARVIIEDLKIPRNIRNTVLDEDVFWVQLQNSLQILTPIFSAIRSSEPDTALLSEIPNHMPMIKTSVFENLSASPLTTAEKTKVKDFIKKREEFCCHPIHAAANLLDPRFKGNGVSDENTAAAFDWITKQAAHLGPDVGKILSNVAEYRISSGIWARNAFWDSAKHIPPATWWQGLCTTQPLIPLASRLLQISASSAACERIWSVFVNIHTKSRNKLTCERVEKLVSIHANLTFLEVHEKNDKEEEEEETENDSSSSENEIDK